MIRVDVRVRTISGACLSRIFERRATIVAKVMWRHVGHSVPQTFATEGKPRSARGRVAAEVAVDGRSKTDERGCQTAK